jgi:hypothetical protein
MHNIIIENDLVSNTILMDGWTYDILLKESRDAALLYSFYCNCSRRQNTNSVYATNTFCKRGLQWGDHKFKKAKKILIDKNLISLKVERHKDGENKGRIKKTYVKIHYIRNQGIDNDKIISGAVGNQVAQPLGCSENINAYKYNINTYKKKEIVGSKEPTSTKVETQSAEKILELWNTLASKVKGLSEHDSIFSKVTINGQSNYKVLFEVISSYLQIYPVETISRAIHKYGQALLENKYYYSVKFKSLGMFLVSDKGLANFVDSDLSEYLIYKEKNTDKFEVIRQEFEPVTTIYNKNKNPDFDKNIYFGIDLKFIKSPTMRMEDVEDALKGKREFNFQILCDLEMVIASLLFTRKQDGDLNYDKLLNYFNIWKEKRFEFKKEARKHLQSLDF